MAGDVEGCGHRLTAPTRVMGGADGVCDVCACVCVRVCTRASMERNVTRAERQRGVTSVER